MKLITSVGSITLAIALSAFLTMPAATENSVAPVSNPCPRLPAGSIVQNPPALFSSGGSLKVQFSYQHVVDAANRDLFCFMTPDGKQNPTLHLRPGDHLMISVTNNTPPGDTPMVLNAPTC